MTARAEIEDMLAQQAWADRNGLERPFSSLAGPGAVLPPAQMLRDHELKTYRDYPREYDDDSSNGMVAVVAVLAVLLLFAVGLIAGTIWGVHRLL